ncbi:MAG: glycoside hydrolase family 5 protein [Eubacterium sp.]|nr:glycoside hydrolase family 5 protein [Eubacterium sp.]
MRKNRKTAFAVYALALALVFTACGSSGGSTSEDVTGTAASTAGTEAATGDTEAGTEEKTTEATGSTTEQGGMLPEVVIPEMKMEGHEVPESEAFSFVKDLSIGVSLGNTFDAYNDTNLKNEMDAETVWCGIKTSEQMIKDFHAAGFETIRIPVSWHNHIVDDDCTISAEWMDRVNTVVDWAINDGMYVILNIHHDNHEEAKGFYPDRAHQAQSEKYIRRIWEQLSERYKDYDEKLIFEAMNEPRLVGHKYEWWFPSGDADVAESVQCINELNQLFVNTVRASGGKNATRYLMCPGYDASADGALHADYKLPEEPADYTGTVSHILVSVHAYTPYSFALDLSGTSEFSLENTSGTSEIDGFMSRLYQKFIVNGTPVVIGEFGAVDKDKNLQARVDFAAYYVAKARSYGMTALWWDNNAFTGNGESLGLYYRRGGYFIYEDIVKALMLNAR